MAGDNPQTSNSKAPKMMIQGHTSSGRWGSNLDDKAAVTGAQVSNLPGRLTKG